MMQAHMNAMSEAAQAQGLERAGTRLGTISGYDASNFLAKVILQPDGVETAWLPIGSIGVGNGWGLQVGPSIGDLVEVEFQDGGIDAGLITHRFFNDLARPLAVPSGEVWFVHKNGQFIKLLTDGTISSAGAWNHDGTFHATGNINSDADIIAAVDVMDLAGGKSMAGMRAVYNGHHHGASPTPDATM